MELEGESRKAPKRRRPQPTKEEDQDQTKGPASLLQNARQAEDARACGGGKGRVGARVMSRGEKEKVSKCEKEARFSSQLTVREKQ